MVSNVKGDEANPLNRITQIIPDGSKVLDVGAGNGLLAMVLKSEHPGLVIDGIEPDPGAAKIAEGSYRNLYRGYAQDFLAEIQDESYDYIVLADVLEHIADPLEFLGTLYEATSRNTKLIVSVPNVAFGNIRMSLCCGSFDYVDTGILEKTHLRFFTAKTLYRFIVESKYNAEYIFFLRRNAFKSEGLSPNVRLNPFTVAAIFRDELASVYQFLVVLQKDEATTVQRSFGKCTDYPVLRYLNYRRKILFK